MKIFGKSFDMDRARLRRLLVQIEVAVVRGAVSGASAMLFHEIYAWLTSR